MKSVKGWGDIVENMYQEANCISDTVSKRFLDTVRKITEDLVKKVNSNISKVDDKLKSAKQKM